jgi:tripartite-type tricarboxylate transporter receptor subunit TctC
VKGGALRAVATLSPKRAEALPELPTVREQDFPNLELFGWNGFFAPAKTPREIVERLSKETAAAVKHPEVAKRLREMAAEPVGSTGAEL